jgi:hypothetical protein
VLGALLGILEVGLHQSTRLNDVNAATLSGRSTLTRVVDELHSACISSKFAPVKKGSSETALVLVNGYGESASLPTPSATGATTKAFEGVRKDTIEWVEEPKLSKEGLLRDKVQIASGEANGEGEYPWGEESPKGGLIIGERLSVSESKVGSPPETPPMFTYYAYASSASTNVNAESTTLTKIKLASGSSLNEAQAKTVAAVGLAFHALPGDKTSAITSRLKETGVDLSSLVTFAFSAPNSEATIKAGPCE